jgi:hypothetical protein
MIIKIKSMACWVKGKPNIKSIITPNHEALGTNNEVYNPTFNKDPLILSQNITSLHKTKYLAW